MVKIGDIVRIVKQSKMNSHISNMGYIGIVDECNDFALNANWFYPDLAFGATDIESVDVIGYDELTLEQKASIPLRYRKKDW